MQVSRRTLGNNLPHGLIHRSLHLGATACASQSCMQEEVEEILTQGPSDPFPIGFTRSPQTCPTGYAHPVLVISLHIAFDMLALGAQQVDGARPAFLVVLPVLDGSTASVFTLQLDYFFLTPGLRVLLSIFGAASNFTFSCIFQTIF